MPPDTLHEGHEITYVALLLNRHVPPEPNHKETLRPSQTEEQTTKTTGLHSSKTPQRKVEEQFQIKRV